MHKLSKDARFWLAGALLLVLAAVGLRAQIGGGIISSPSSSGGSGTVTNTGGNLTSNAVVLGAGTADTKVVAGVVTDGTSKLTLGVAGSSVGAVALNNGTSGSITLQPVTGALGTDTQSLPAATGTYEIVLCNTGTTSATTNANTETNLAVCTIPAGSTGTNGRIIYETIYKFVGTAGSKTPTIRLSTSSGDTSAGAITYSAASGSTSLSFMMTRSVWNSNSASAQVFSNNTVSGINGTSTVTVSTGAINTANLSYLNFNCLTANSGDTCAVLSFTVKLVPGVCIGTAPSC